MEKFNIAPWDIPVETRISELKAAKKSGKKIAVMIYPALDFTSSFRYRAYNPYQATKRSSKWQLVYFFTHELSVIFENITDLNLLILGRIEKWQPEYDELVFKAKSQGLNVAFDLDDCVCGTKYIKNMFNVVSPDSVDQEYWIKTSANIELISYLADGFIATNDYLGKILSETHEHKPYKVINNFLNDEQVLYSSKLKKDQRNENFTIGYFSGSHTHLTDFEVVYPELTTLLDEHSNFKLKIVGTLDLPDSANKYLKSGQIETYPAVDFLTLQRYISEVNVNIVPLADNVFTDCKSNLKFFEASLVNTPTVASPSYAYRTTIKNGSTGFLCYPGEWHDTILQQLYNDSRTVEEITKAAHKYCLENYYGERILKQIEKTYDYYEKL